ncbi:cold-shock protein [Streptomyces avermitilis]|uniref:cold-shock protein n=1 Tax=Streptomyces avermitilis TaxID=33903 RepID=UPI0036ADC7A0
MATGTVKSFDQDKGYGCISQDDGGAGGGVHFSVVQSNGFRKLEKNQRVEYEEPWT